MKRASIRAAVFVSIVFALSACNVTAALHSPQDYAKATSLGDPDGSLTEIVGPATPIVEMTSGLKFPQGDIAPAVRSVLMYDKPSTSAGMCVFQIGYSPQRSFTVIKEDEVTAPCDGKRWARFHIAGADVGFVAHLAHMNYKGTPVTLLEISDHQQPDSIRVVY